MHEPDLPRREFLRMLAGIFSVTVFDWDAFPRTRTRAEDGYDAIIIGSGLGGLSCAAAFARQGFKPLVIERHDKPGGFATAFSRPGGFRFDVSLHSTTVQQRNGVYNLISGFPEITDVEFVPHPSLFRAVYPEHDIRVTQRDVKGYIASLIRMFPEEESGITALFDDMQGLAGDIGRLSNAKGQVDMSRFVTDYPVLAKHHRSTWGNMLDSRLRNSRLKAIVSAQWGYYGLPPSKLSCFYYALPFMGYLAHGGFYPRGRSQDISDALVKIITSRGGTVLLNTGVESILMKDGAAIGVRTASREEFRSKVVVSNADPFETFLRLVGKPNVPSEYTAHWREFNPSLSCFQVFLGLKTDLVKKLDIPDSEIFLESSYDPEAGYSSALGGDVERGGLGVTLYDNIFTGYSPEGKNTLNLLTLQGYEPWERFEAEYRAGNKTEYRKAKERMADILIQRAEKLLPGLTAAIEVKDIGTPLTNVRYTGHHRGAIYGWDQTVNNSGSARVGHETPIKNLYLAGAWSRPGHGYGAVIPSGLECFAEIMKHW